MLATGSPLNTVVALDPYQSLKPARAPATRPLRLRYNRKNDSALKSMGGRLEEGGAKTSVSIANETWRKELSEPYNRRPAPCQRHPLSNLWGTAVPERLPVSRLSSAKSGNRNTESYLNIPK